MTNFAIKKGCALLLVCLCLFGFMPGSAQAAERELNGSFVWSGIEWNELIRTGYTQDDGQVIWRSGDLITIVPVNLTIRWFDGSILRVWGIQTETSDSFKEKNNQSVETTFIDEGPGRTGRLYVEEYINPSIQERWRIDWGPYADGWRLLFYWISGTGTEMEWRMLGQQIIGPPRITGEHTMGLRIRNNGEFYWQLDGAEGRVEFCGTPVVMKKIDMVTLAAIGSAVTFSRCNITAFDNE
jgi:hypothetical protein